jgi:hypothetical protein
MTTRRVTARVAHEIPERAPLRLTPGETVTVGDRDTDWPAFVFVTAAHGSGWVPARHLSPPVAGTPAAGTSAAETSGEGAPSAGTLAAGTRRARVETAYDTTELPTCADQPLDVLAEDLPSGWLWCRAVNGREGWVPCNTLIDPA